MADNPLMRRPDPSGFGPDGNPRDPDAYVAWLNRMNWVRASGFHYYVARRKDDDGEERWSIERQDRKAA